jgi:alpha-tubulin suppressor-like RCC1 family protein
MLTDQTIAAGFSHSCVIASSGKLYVWGDNKNSQLTLDSNVMLGLHTS